MMQRDERWEKVWASVGSYSWPDEDELGVPHDPIIEFLIEVIYAGTVWYNRILVSEEELKAFPELYQKTLDKMVEGIDSHINRGPDPRKTQHLRGSQEDGP